MQPAKVKDLCSSVCVKDSLDEEGMISLVDFIFKECKAEWGRLNNLSIYLDSFCIFYYGKTRLRELGNRIIAIQKSRGGGIKQKHSFFYSKTDDELQEMLDKVEGLLIRYEKFIQQKKECRKSNKALRNKPEEHMGISAG